MKILNIVTNLFNKYISTLFSSHEDMVNYIFTNDSLPAPLDDNDESPKAFFSKKTGSVLNNKKFNAYQERRAKPPALLNP